MTATLDRRRNERLNHHRALLLFAMQHPERRSIRAVARAMCVSESTVRGWRKKREWRARSDAPEAEETAVAMYRRLYLPDHGPSELPEVIDNVIVPMSANPSNQPPPATFQDDISSADRVARQEILRRRSNEKAVREKHVNLVDGALGYVVKQLTDGKIRASLRDIPNLLTCRALLTGEAGMDGADGSGIAAVETVRVRATRAAGGDVLEAMLEDMDEFRLIIGSLRTRQEVVVEPEVESEGSHLSVVE